MRKISFIFILLVLINSIFANKILLENLRLNREPAQFVIDVKGNKIPRYSTNYDDKNRYLFIEFFNTKASSKLKNKIVNGQYVKKIYVKKYKNSTGFFIFFKNNINYTTKYFSHPKRFVLNFDKNRYKKEYTIIVDAGHGGKDSGATGFNRYDEKDIALKIAKDLRYYLKPNFNVVMTRTNDTFVTLSGRPNIGNKYKGDFFVSIHLNSSYKKDAEGADVFYFSRTESNYAKKIAAFENSVGNKFGENVDDIKLIMGQLFYRKNQKISMTVADSLVNLYTKSMRMDNRGAHGANFAVLRGFDGPGILVETGFISNRSDINKLKTSRYQKLAAKNIAKAIKKYFYKNKI